MNYLTRIRALPLPDKGQTIKEWVTVIFYGGRECTILNDAASKSLKTYSWVKLGDY